MAHSVLGSLAMPDADFPSIVRACDGNIEQSVFFVSGLTSLIIV